MMNNKDLHVIALENFRASFGKLCEALEALPYKIRIEFDGLPFGVQGE